MKHSLKHIGIFIGLGAVGTANAQSFVWQREIVDVHVGWAPTSGAPEIFNYNRNTSSVGTGHYWVGGMTNATYSYFCLPSPL